MTGKKERYMEESSIELRTRNKEEFIDITHKINEKIKDIEKGICLIFCPHTTAGLTINEGADPTVKKDILEALDNIVPKLEFEHSEGNSPAHIKTSLAGSSVQIIIEDGKLKLGTWQSIFFCEFDGPRKRNVFLQVIKEKA